MRDERRDDGDDEGDGEDEGSEDIEVFVPATEDGADPLHGRRMVADALAEQREAFGEEVVADVLDAAGVARVVVRHVAGFDGELEGDLSGFDFAGVGVFGEFGDADVVGVASLVFHVGEDVAGVLAEDCVEGNQGLQDVAPFELVQAAHAVEDRGEGGLLDGRHGAGGEGFVGAIEDVFELCELQGLREDGDLFKEQGIVLLGLLNVDGERLGRPNAAGGGEVAFGEVDGAGQVFVAVDANAGERGEGGAGVVAGDESGLQHAGAFEQLELGGELLGVGGLAAAQEKIAEAQLQLFEAIREAGLAQVDGSISHWRLRTAACSRRASSETSGFSGRLLTGVSRAGAVGGRTYSETMGSSENGAMMPFSISWLVLRAVIRCISTTKDRCWLRCEGEATCSLQPASRTCLRRRRRSPSVADDFLLLSDGHLTTQQSCPPCARWRSDAR